MARRYPETAGLGARDSFREARPEESADALPEFAQLAVEGRFSVQIARTFPLEDWRTALHISRGGHARGKLLLIPASNAEAA